MKVFKSAVRLLFLAVPALLAGCGLSVNYRNVVADLDYEGTKSVRVVTHDQRPYILDGKKNLNFVGLSRGGYGNPFSVATASGKPLADDITSVIVASLKKNGFNASPVKAEPENSAAEVAAQLQGDTGILLTMREWKSDTMTSCVLLFDVDIKVLSASGQELAEKKLKGTEYLGISMFNPSALHQKRAPATLKKKLEELLNDPDVARALRK